MQINRNQISQLLKDFDFEFLLVDLGWDRYRGEVNTEIRETGVDESEYQLTAIAQKRGLAVFLCPASTNGTIPDYATRRKIQREAAKSVLEHLIIYTDAEKTTQIWQWVKREQGKPLACREHPYHRGQSGESLIQKLEIIAVSLDEEEDITLTDVRGRVRAAFDVERVTKRFYDHFKTEHAQFLNFLNGIPDQEMGTLVRLGDSESSDVHLLYPKEGFSKRRPRLPADQTEGEQSCFESRSYRGKRQ